MEWGGGGGGGEGEGMASLMRDSSHISAGSRGIIDRRVPFFWMAARFYRILDLQIAGSPPFLFGIRGRGGSGWAGEPKGEGRVNGGPEGYGS